MVAKRMPGWMWACFLGSVVLGIVVGAVAGRLWGALTILLTTLVSSQIVLTLRRRRGKGLWNPGREYPGD